MSREKAANNPQSPEFGLGWARDLAFLLFSSKHLIWILLLIAVVIRGAFALRNPSMEWDASHYRAIAHHLATGQGYTSDGLHPETYWAPLAPFLIAGVYKLGGGNLAVREVWALLGVCLVFAVYGLGRVQHGLVAANLAAFAAAFYPYNIVVGASTSTEIPSILFILLTILFLCSWLNQGKSVYSLLAGASLGLAVLDRPAAVVFLPLGVILHYWRFASVPRVRCIAACVLFVGAAGVIFVPWSIRTSRVAGTLCVVTSGGAWNLWFGNNPWLEDYSVGKMSADDIGRRLRAVIPPDADTEAQKDKAMMSALRQFVVAQPVSELRLLAFKTIQFWEIPGMTARATDPSVKSLRSVIILVGCFTYVPIALLAGLSVIYHIQTRQVNRIGIYLAWIVLTFISYVWFPAVTRFRFAGGLDNLMIVLSAAYLGATVFYQQTARTFRRQREPGL
ncbi:MAG: glycosyltransferase family 39 protein [Candidatus Sulfotelmatobacter sp.]